jgi:UDP-N-acetylmuramyl pentapeptide phosphotransferase/UDP-N-acetylglucosamine-1-phosphate transferase
MTYLEALLANPFLLGGSFIMAAFMLSLKLYPVIIHLVRDRNLMDEPEERSIHTCKTPTLGGVGLFITFSLSIILAVLTFKLVQPDLIKLLSLLAAIIILLFLGIKDDLLVLSPSKKIIGQIVAAYIVIFFADLRIHNLFGLFGVGELPYLVSVLLTIFVFVFIINAFNLVDGIDGLAGAIALTANVAFGVFFLMNDQFLMVLVSFIMAGALMGFLRFNLSATQKIFMGDSGSLFIGFLLAYEAIYFLGMDETLSTFMVPNAPIIVLAIFSFPIVDTLRVFVIRIYNKRSPFKADRNHIHHGLLRLGINHKQATILVVLSTVFNIEMAIIVSALYINVQLYIVLLAFPMVCLFPLALARNGNKNGAAGKPFEIQSLTMEDPINGNGMEWHQGIANKGKTVLPAYGLKGQSPYLSATRKQKKAGKKLHQLGKLDQDLDLI